MDIDDESPIFLVGTGRCGSTLLHKLLSGHPQVSYLSSILTRLPEAYLLNRIGIRLHSHRTTRRWLGSAIGPSEAWPFWDSHAPGFSEPSQDLWGTDVTEQICRDVTSALDRVRASGRPRLVIKLTGWTRLGWIHEVYPQSPIIHLVRNPHDVAYSLLNVPFWRGWSGPDEWRWGALTESEQHLWEDADRSPISLAAIQWKKILEAHDEALRHLPDAAASNVLELTYEDLTDRTDETLQRILGLTDLGDLPAFRDWVGRFDISNRNGRWASELPEPEQKRLRRTLEAISWQSYLPPRAEPDKPLPRHD